jgi:subfamily B ATP-binding cassette protein MsbA
MMRIVRAQDLPSQLIEFFASVGIALVFLYVAFVTRSQMSDFVQFIGSIFLMYQPIKAISRLHNQLEQGRAASRHIFSLLASHPTVVEPAQPAPLRAAGADIHFDHVDFDYGEKPVLRDIHLTAKAGQLVALVGSSGSGKTTITNLLLRFYDPQKGRVRIGDTDIRTVSLRDLRNQIAVVTQETVLFNDTIYQNIGLGSAGSSNGEIEAAARHAHAHGFIVEKERGYATVIGERGVQLSGGQRQRLAIARAILRNAPILILDEATSALDTESERAVQEALEELMRGRTTICIAHRLSTIQKADLIVVLDQGRIVESGKHAELMARGGLYRKLHELQFRQS